MREVKACYVPPTTTTTTTEAPTTDTTVYETAAAETTTTTTTTTTPPFTPTFILYKSDAPKADDDSGSNANRMEKYVLLVGFVSVLVR